MPAGIVELKHDDEVASGAGVACEGFEQLGEEPDIRSASLALRLAQQASSMHAKITRYFDAGRRIRIRIGSRDCIF
jgi:hypothetical protein